MASTSGSVGGEVTGETGSPLAKPSLPPPRPKSPPEYPDLYGKRREAARVQMLEREISYLEAKVVDLLNLGSYYIQGENKFIEGAQPASRCCKEVSDFVVANSDPLIPAQRKNRRHCRFWKWLCPSAATAQVAAALGPNAVTGHAAEIVPIIILRSPSAATAQVAAALGPNAVTGHAAQISVVARNRAARAVHASEVAVVLVQTWHAAYPPVSAVALDRRVSTRRRAHVAAATARSDGHLVVDVPT
ncbi:hypothetical protein DY000_02018341 [Brassica cretica]|uniref:G protein gamma domain-containing protein n=1 Tax=Brassica cretica TaxID=69181 RepID=A0ABQ7CTY4_BRACR|nr:hypothetical protein DY000_02018341 [Brassica cretica]